MGKLIGFLVGGALAALAAGVVGAVACGGGASGDRPTEPPRDAASVTLAPCGATTQPFTVPPVALSDLIGWVPLGNVAPPGHLFPTDHQYLYVNHPSQPATIRAVPFVAPGNVTITRAHRTHYSSSNTDDYSIEFGACDEIRGELGHVTTIDPAILARLGAFDQQCSSYSLGSGTSEVFSNCYTNIVMIPVAAGAPLGTTGGQGTSFALDWSLFDRRVPPIAFANPARWVSNASGVDRFHVVAANEYFAEPARSAIRARVGSFDGSRIRVAAPAGGTIAVDVAGTLQGVWINPAQPTFPEGPHLAFVPDPVDPSRIAISIGTSQPFVAAGLTVYDPSASGSINRHPAAVRPDGTIYCFDAPGLRGALLVRLDDAATLRVEGKAEGTRCAESQPWTFGANAFVYKR